MKEKFKSQCSVHISKKILFNYSLSLEVFTFHLTLFVCGQQVYYGTLLSQ